MIPQIVLNESNKVIVELNNQRFYFSYRTCIAFADFHSGIRIRLENTFSRTTGKHFTQLGVKEWEVVSPDVFERTVAQAMRDAYSLSD